MTGPSAAEIFGPIAEQRRAIERLPGGGHVYLMPDAGVRIEARDIRKTGGQVYAQITVICDWHGVKNPISSAWQNISSQTARNALAKYSQQRTRSKPDDFDWHDAIDSSQIAFIEADRIGTDTPIVLDDAPETTDRDFDVLGLKVPADAASMLIAHGDSLKSMIALLVGGTLAQRGLRVLYCDFEWSPERHKGRKRKLFGADRLSGLRYLRCHAPYRSCAIRSPGTATTSAST